MINLLNLKMLLKANNYKLKKEKIIKLFILLSFGVAIMTIGLLLIIAFLDKTGLSNEPTYDVLGMINAESVFLSGISLGQNVCLLMIVGVAIYLGKEFSYNTIRNKVIVGYTKQEIYIANFITTFKICMFMYLAYEIVAVAVAWPIFGWSNSFSITTLIQQIVISLAVLLSLAATINTLAMLSRSMVGSILYPLLIVIGGTLTFTLMFSFPLQESVYNTFLIIAKSNFIGQSFVINFGVDTSFLISSLISTSVYVGLLVIGGSYYFKQLDLK